MGDARTCVHCGEPVTAGECPCVAARRRADDRRRKAEQEQRQRDGMVCLIIKVDPVVVEVLLHAADPQLMLRELSKRDLEEGLEKLLPALSSRVNLEGL